MNKKMVLRVKEKFDAAHQLNDYEGKCARIHGHTWKVEVYIQVEEIQPNGISIDFYDIKSYLREFLPDHQLINDYLDMKYPTAENLIQYFYTEIKKKFPGLIKIVLWETENNGVEYSEL